MYIKRTLSLAAAMLILSGCGVANDVTVCTDAPQSQWLDQSDFKTTLQAKGYSINEFKVTDGSCYEIYGTDKDNKKVEIYFNPVDGSVVKQEAH
ncbi:MULTISPECIES: PepSY domain-containing protein [Pseudoalteromonas]|uniref:PepSY domain-containing protein n=1 Tax=Pseudoalteromonas ruthenica TaxID=151081 RepID=A0A0F4PYE5_9GAMM|nr:MULTISPECIES: PepSY domain-containing protein [Pseudoalteromonas]KJY99708.1 hypothetical protein TW72_08645 [Pseudoalteromonas ruthenica]KJZ00074.1 hypothetical protein TW76_02265 [Pseudoalteromonas ruthenica]TMO88221.1 PepSY domain-containing protein [Pseudoalteromonas ruthenica]TMO93098.1 PepSY domain-containing protein [Pseudoalteromonas ruthenica]TMP00413.1 PepSY domain-containing protein [Pseudoalteromonas ruthenica]